MHPLATFKVILLGEDRASKTAIALRYLGNCGDDEHIGIQKASFKTKKLTVNGR